MAYDSHYSQVVLLLDGETLYDAKGKLATAYGNAAVSAAQYKYGTHSFAFDGTGDYLLLSDHADWHLSNGDFTIELWFNATSGLSGERFLISQWDGGGGTGRSFELSVDSGHLYFVFSTDGTGFTTAISAATTFTTSTWYHIAVCRSGTSVKAFVDGTQVGSTYTIGTSSLFNATTPIEIGAGSLGTAFALTGYIDEVRITKYARYTSNFTAPTEAFPQEGLEELIAEAVALADNPNNINILYNGVAGFSLVDAAVATDPTQLDLFIAGPSESVIAVSAFTYNVVQWFYESIAASDAATTQVATTLSYAEQVQAASLLVQFVEQLIAESAEGTEDWFINSSVAIAELVAVVGITTDQAAVIQVLSELIVGLEAIQTGGQESIGESVEATSIMTNLLNATQAVIAQAIATDAQTSYLLLINTIDESANAGEAVTIWQSLTQMIDEGVTAFVHLSIGGETYTGWVMNTANGAASEYQGLNFNSLCKIGNRYFGASDTGIHEIAGNDDDGTSIATYVQSGLIDFGTALEKSIPVAYLGADIDGRVALGVSVSEKSVVSTYWYEANRELAAINNVKVPIGKGLSGRYWKFGIASDALSEFDAVTVIPVTLKRRV